MRTVHLPIRIDFLGGWSDQECWDGPAAVINGAFGWDGAGCEADRLYPITIEHTGFARSHIRGIGTGLGISSIRAAGQALVAGHTDWQQAVREDEQRNGTRGGWQDARGAIEPGFKLLTRDATERNDAHPILNHLVLFDTGTRRNSQVIGDKVRELIRTSRGFRKALTANVADAARIFWEDDLETFVYGCLEGWERLVRFVPEMDDFLFHPLSRERRWKFCGAGGGGYGVEFVREPEQRAQLVADLRWAGMWATIPILLPGAVIEDALVVAA